MSDDQGWGDTGYNGHPQLETPNMDAMAEEGVRFDRFYAAAPVCSPTRGSCLTGRHPFRYGIFSANEGYLPDEESTLVDVLGDRGYATGHFGKWHLGTLTWTVRESNRGGPRGAEHYAPPWERGFDECFSTEAAVPTRDPMIDPDTVEDPPGRDWEWDPRLDPEPSAHRGNGDGGVDSFGTYYWTGLGQVASENLDGDDSRVIMDRVVPFIEGAADSDTPFFAVVWFHSPHSPVVAGERHRDRYANRSVNEQHYYGTITAIDEQIGRLRDTLSELGVAENTMLWFCSDNGPAAAGGGPGWEKGRRQQGETGKLRGRKGTLYEGGIRVPGTLVWPDKIEESRVVEAPCVTSDYYPTVLDAVGIDAPDSRPTPVDGVSLLPLIEGQTDKRPEPIGFESHGMQALVDNEYKLVRKAECAPFELYDLDADPYETDDLADEEPETVDSMARALKEWRDSCDRSRAGADYA